MAARPWRRGRGLGLTIIDRVMDRVDYYPGRTVGNITVLHCPGGAVRQP